jgi:threonine/homoserine/homoserine lactone efflux protein
MEPLLFVKGLAIGFAMAIPIGPMGVLCVRTSLSEGQWRGLVIGLAAATADSLYGSVAAFSLSFVSDVIVSQQVWMRLIGGAILVVIGIDSFRPKQKEARTIIEGKGRLKSYFSALLLALTNPGPFFAFVAVFAAFGIGQSPVVSSAGILVLGVFAGSCLWFRTLGYIASAFRHKLDAGGLRWVNRTAGVLILLSGVAAFVSVM